MLAVNVQESTTTTGTGNITLDGSSEDGRTFTSQRAINERFNYYIDDRAGNWEHGIGYLSGATTLVRETLLDSSTGSTVNFGAGTKQVFEGFSPIDVFSDGGYNTNTALGRHLRSDGSQFTGTSTNTLMQNNRSIGGRFRAPFGMLVNQALIECTTAVAATNIKMALYQLDKSGNATNRIATCHTNTFDTSTTGLKTASLDEGDVYIPKGDYLVVIKGNGAPNLRMLSNSTFDNGVFGGLQAASALPNRGMFDDSVTYADAFPATWVANWSGSSSVNYPLVIFNKV